MKAFNSNSSASRPLYLQAKDRILKIVRKKEPGQVLPHERELALEWGVSRITIRNAYGRLVQDGYVMKTHKAYRVAPCSPRTGLFMLNGFTQDAHKRGNIPKTEVLGIELIYPAKPIASCLLLKSKQRAYRLIRRRSLNDKLIAVEYAYLSEEVVPGLDRCSLESLYKTLHKKYQIKVYWAQQYFSFHSKKSPEHEILGVPPEEPLLHLKRISFSEKNNPIEFVDGYYDIRHFAFYLEIQH